MPAAHSHPRQHQLTCSAQADWQPAQTIPPPPAGLGSPCTRIKGGQTRALLTGFPQGVEAVVRRKRYLELSRRCVVRAGGFSSPGAGKGSRNPASERGSACKALFHEEDKPRGDGSPLKGWVAQPRLPAAEPCPQPACSPPLKSRSPKCSLL